MDRSNKETSMKDTKTRTDDQAPDQYDFAEESHPLPPGLTPTKPTGAVGFVPDEFDELMDTTHQIDAELSELSTAHARLSEQVAAIATHLEQLDANVREISERLTTLHNDVDDVRRLIRP
jgi:hypothetical protein